MSEQTPRFREPVVVPTDDCPVGEGDDVRYPHQGQTVTVRRGLDIGEIQMLHGFQQATVELTAIEGDEDQYARALAIMADMAAMAIPVLRRRVIDWDWTDEYGEVLPKPSEDPEVFGRLTVHEMAYLLVVIRGETDGERKNGSRPSQTTSSATARQRSRG